MAVVRAEGGEVGDEAADEVATARCRRRKGSGKAK
jgi:hypothetical protein